MTITIDLDPAAPAVAASRWTTRGMPARLVRAEFRKLTSTRTWWILGGGVVLGTVLSIMYALLQATDDLAQLNADVIAAENVPAIQVIAANVFTSGQFLGALCTMLLAILLMTNEYHHETVTTTFLITPRRTPVLLAKSIVAAGAALLFWAVATVIDLLGGAVFLHSRDVPTHLTDPAVFGKMLTSLLVYALWAVFGIGIGALLRHQVWATSLATAMYLLGFWTTWLALDLISQDTLHNDGLERLAVLSPSVAAQIAVSSKSLFAYSAPPWVAVVVMLGEGVLMAAVGAVITKRRDIS